MSSRNAAIKRLQQELQAIKRGEEKGEEGECCFKVTPLEDNPFEWHFTIKGAPDSDYEGGLYHGKIIFPTDYPFKPPDIVILTV